MQVLIVRALMGISVVLLGAMALVEPASACFPACTLTPQPAPGPLMGLGLPLAGAAVVALFLVRRFRHKD